MPFFKQTWQFSAPGGTRWQEVLYVESTNIAQAANISVDLIDARVALLHPVGKLQKIRVNNILVAREAIPVPVNKVGTYPADPVQDEPQPANRDEAAVITLGSLVGSSRKLWMRGIGEDAVFRSQDGNLDIQGTPFSQRLNSWLTLLCDPTTPYIVLTKQRPTVGQNPRTTITNVTPTVGGARVILKTSQAHFLVEGDLLQIGNVSPKQFPGLKGQFQVLVAPAADEVEIAYKSNYAVATVPARGYLYKIIYRTGAKLVRSLAAFQYLGSRRSKNLDSGSRGARPSQKLRQ